MNYSQGSSGDGDTEDRLTDMGGEARVGDEDGTNGEKGLEPRTRPCVEQTARRSLLNDSGSSYRGPVTTQRGGTGHMYTCGRFG